MRRSCLSYNCYRRYWHIMTSCQGLRSENTAICQRAWTKSLVALFWGAVEINWTHPSSLILSYFNYQCLREHTSTVTLSEINTGLLDYTQVHDPEDSSVQCLGTGFGAQKGSQTGSKSREGRGKVEVKNTSKGLRPRNTEWWELQLEHLTVELVNTVPFKVSSHYESLTKLNRVVWVTWDMQNRDNNSLLTIYFLIFI